MFAYMARTVIREKIKLQSHPVNTVGFYSSQIMEMSACNTCGKSVKERNSIKCNLCLTKVHLKCNYLIMLIPST